MFHAYRARLLGGVVAAAAGLALWSTPAPALNLSAEELAWIQANPVVKVAATSDWPPFEFVDGDGAYLGICADMIHWIAARAGFTVEPVTGPWPELYQRLREGTLDVSPSMQASPERAEHLLFTRSYLNFPHAIYGPANAPPVESIEALAGKRVAVERDYFEHEYLRKHHPGFDLRPVPNALEALLLVSRGEADAYVGNVAVTGYLIDTNVLTGVRMGGYARMGQLELSMGVRSGAPLLASILDKGIAALTPEEKQRMVGRYSTASMSIELTAEEREWVRQHPEIRLGVDPEFAPFEFVDTDGSYRGMASDYIALLNQRLGLNLRIVHTTGWRDAVEQARAGNLDVLPCLGVSEARKDFLAFTSPYLSFHRVVITRLDTPFVGGAGELAGLQVGVQRDSSHAAYLDENTTIPPIEFDSFQETLAAVASGTVDCAVGNAATAAYWIKKLGLTNLKLAVPLEGAVETLHFGVRKDWPLLVSILEKGLKSINEEEAMAIRRKWMDVEVQPGIDMRRVWTAIGGVLAIALPIVLLVAFHNYRLRREIHSRLLAENALRRYDFIVNTVREMMSVVNRDGRYEAVNDEWCAATGIPREDALGHSIAEVWSEQTTAMAIQPRLARCFGGETVNYESLIALPAQGDRHLEVTMYPFIEGGHGVTHAIVVAKDITERKRYEEALRKAMEAAEAGTRAKSAFLANMSHEIRTPLNAVLGYTQLLQRSTNLSPDQRHAVDAIQRSGDHLLGLISDILEISRIEAGRVELMPEPFLLDSLLSDIEIMFRVKTEAKGLTLDVERDPRLPRCVVADRGRVSQVLINLLGNAIKFTQEGGISLRARRGTGAGDGFELIFDVEDTGCGIAEHERAAVFGTFEQVGAAGLRQGGAGLGLSICRSFARMMGGDVTVDSELGRGSCFRFVLLAREGEEASAPESSTPRRYRALRAGQGEQRVLVVDDRDTNRDILCRLLGELGFVTREAENGLEAIAAVESWRPQVVLIDLVMPVMGGQEAIRHIRELPQVDPATVLIALTASTMGEEKPEVLAAGANAFLRKPFRAEVLLDEIQRHTGLEFEYDEDRAETAPAGGTGLEEARAAVAALPEALALELRSVLTRGAIAEAKTLAEKLREHDARLAELLARRARDYRLNELQDWIVEVKD